MAAAAAHCFYCFECLSASFEGREPPSLQKVVGIWGQYETSRTLLQNTRSVAATCGKDADGVGSDLDMRDEDSVGEEREESVEEEDLEDGVQTGVGNYLYLGNTLTATAAPIHLSPARTDSRITLLQFLHPIRLLRELITVYPYQRLLGLQRWHSAILRLPPRRY